MNMVSRDPWSVFDQLQNDINRVFESRGTQEGSGATSDWTPTVDIEEYAEKFIIVADIPGVETDQIEVTLENGVLTIQGDRNLKDVKESAQSRRLERPQGRFYRRFVLPDTTNAEDVSANGNNGVLEITIPKVSPAQPRKIEIK